MADEHERPRVLFYVQHLLGIGHLARASRVAGGARRGRVRGHVVTGGTPVPGFPGPGVESVRCRRSPRPTKGFSELIDASGKPIDDAYKARRRDMLLAALADDAARNRRDRGLSVRAAADALRAVAAARSDRGHDAQAGAGHLGARHSPGAGQSRPQRGNGRDRQPAFRPGAWCMAIRPSRGSSDTFPLAAAITAEIAYTGLVAAPPPGAVGRATSTCWSRSAAARPASSWSTPAVEAAARLSAGQALVPDHRPQPAAGRFRRGSARRRKECRNLPLPQGFSVLLAGAGLSVSQAGYNTVCDILQAGCRACWFRSPPAARPSRRCAPSGCSGSGWPSSLPEDALSPSSLGRGDRAAAGRAEARLAHGSISTAPEVGTACCATLLANAC